MNEVRTYLSFTLPVDPAKILTIPDMDLSYALAATLVEWDSDKQLTAGLADSWRVITPNVYRFTLRKNARWSDGRPVTSQQVKASLERGMAAHPEDLKSLQQMLTSIECPSELEIDFKTKGPAQESGLPGKLTEPNFGILRVTSDKNIDLSISSGPFALSLNSNQKELVLGKNQYWYRADKEMPDKVLIRKPADGVDLQAILLKDPWPNLIETSSMINADLLNRYESEKYAIWKRPLDKVFYFQLGKRNAGNEGRALLRYLRAHLNPSDLMTGLSGLTPAIQMFPKGYQLFESGLPESKIKESLPAPFDKKPIEIVFSPQRVSTTLQENIRRAIVKATGVEPHFTAIALENLGKVREQGNYDFYMGTVGLADPDPEGVMSFYLEGRAPIILPNDNNFLDQLNLARKEADKNKRLSQMRRILNDAVAQGYILPLFHLSTIGLGRPELDFSRVPISDESVTLCKIILRRAQQVSR